MALKDDLLTIFEPYRDFETGSNLSAAVYYPVYPDDTLSQRMARRLAASSTWHTFYEIGAHWGVLLHGRLEDDHRVFEDLCAGLLDRIRHDWPNDAWMKSACGLRELACFVWLLFVRFRSDEVEEVLVRPDWWTLTIRDDSIVVPGGEIVAVNNEEMQFASRIIQTEGNGCAVWRRNVFAITRIAVERFFDESSKASFATALTIADKALVEMKAAAPAWITAARIAEAIGSTAGSVRAALSREYKGRQPPYESDTSGANLGYRWTD
ncbi:MAG: hypothetical protein AAF593_00685 [Planctomycetota bacterium]